MARIEEPKHVKKRDFNHRITDAGKKLASVLFQEKYSEVYSTGESFLHSKKFLGVAWSSVGYVPVYKKNKDETLLHVGTLVVRRGLPSVFHVTSGNKSLIHGVEEFFKKKYAGWPIRSEVVKAGKKPPLPPKEELISLAKKH